MYEQINILQPKEITGETDEELMVIDK